MAFATSPGSYGSPDSSWRVTRRASANCRTVSGSDTSSPSRSSSGNPRAVIISATSSSSSGSASAGDSRTSSSSAAQRLIHSCSSRPGSCTAASLPATRGSSNHGSKLPRVQVLVVGSGAREHALAWRLRHSPLLDELHAAPGNPGIATLGRCHPVRADDGDGLLALATTLEVDLVVIGPEAPLVAGVADVLRQNGIAVFGPSAEAARIEGSKAFAKDVLRAAGVPTAETLAVARPPCVVKADGLASGKGVFVCRTGDELDAALRAVRLFEGGVVIEELLEGREVSLFAVADGRRVVLLGAAQDFKRSGDGDTGPNTGGMGACSPVPWLEDAEALVASIHQPVVDELARRGAPFVGCLFAGLMITDDGPKVLEFNARFGDPETQVLMPRVEFDLLAALAEAAAGRARPGLLTQSEEAAVTVVLAGARYPERSDDAGAPIAGAEEVEGDGVIVFHGGTAVRNGSVVTSGGRILSVTALGASLEEARRKAYRAVDHVRFEGMRYRRDIAAVTDA